MPVVTTAEDDFEDYCLIASIWKEICDGLHPNLLDAHISFSCFV